MEELDNLELKLQSRLENPDTANNFEQLMAITTQLEECQQSKETLYQEWETWQLQLEEMV